MQSAPLRPLVGVLYKRRDYVKTYCPRMFVLDGDLLHYYYTKDDSEPKATFCVSGCVVDKTGAGDDVSVGDKSPNPDVRLSTPVKFVDVPEINDPAALADFLGASSGSASGEKRSLKAAVKDRIAPTAFYTFKISHPATTKAYYLAASTDAIRELWVVRLNAAAGNSVYQPPPMLLPSEGRSRRVRGARSPLTLVSASATAAAPPPPPLPRPAPPPPPSSIPGVPAKHLPVIEAKIASLLDLAYQPLAGPDARGWNLLPEKRGVVGATLPDATGGPLLTVRGDGRIPFPPLECLDCLVSVLKKARYDNQVDVGKRVVTWNEHTSVDYIKFKAVWPTSVRDFLNLVHWRSLGTSPDGASLGFVIVAFSIEDSALVPPVSGHVRALCLLGGWVLRPSVQADGAVHTDASIVVQSDLKGSLPSSMVNMVISQQAQFPFIVSKFIDSNRVGEGKSALQRWEGKDCSDAKGIECVMKHLPSELLPPGANAAASSTPSSSSSSSSSASFGGSTPSFGGGAASAAEGSTGKLSPLASNSAAMSAVAAFKNAGERSVARAEAAAADPADATQGTVVLGVRVPAPPHKGMEKPSLAYTATSLLLPVFLWLGSQIIFPQTFAPLRGLAFLFGLFVGLRGFALRRLGEPMTFVDGSAVGLNGNGNGGTGAIRANFVIDLKRVLRYIGESKKDSRPPARPGLAKGGGVSPTNSGGQSNVGAAQTTNGEVSQDEIAITHITLKAVAHVLKEFRCFNGRKVRLPLLGIEGYYPNASIDVSTAVCNNENGSKNIVKVENADSLTAPEIAKVINKNKVSIKKKKEDGVSLSGNPLLGFLRIPLDILSEQLDLRVPALGMEGRVFGSAIVVTTPNNDGNEVEIQVSPIPKSYKSPSGPSIYIVIGGIRVLPSFSKEKGGGAIARPVLNISVTIDCEVANVVSCRKFSERLLELIKKPELLDAA